MKYNAVGNFFFQYRGQIPLVFLILVTVISISTDLQITQAPYYPWIISLAGVIVSTGEILRIITLGYTATHSSGRNRSHQVAEELNTKGMYSIVQHPLYLANMLLWIGVALISNQWAFVLGSLVLSGILFPAIIHQESAFLKKKFGEEYRQWQKKTRSFFLNLGYGNLQGSLFNGFACLPPNTQHGFPYAPEPSYPYLWQTIESMGT